VHCYRIKFANAGAHLIEVSLTIEVPDPAGQKISLPSWIPGSYMIRDYARHVVSVRAESDDVELALSKLDKSTWIADPCERPLVITAKIYAYDLSVRGAHFDTTHAYFNGPCVFFRVHGQEDVACELDIVKPAPPLGHDWRVATSLDRVGAAPYDFGTYIAEDYDELLDHPVEIGQLTIGEFDVLGVPHAIAIRGQSKVDIARICHDLTTLCESHCEFLGVPDDLDRYLFLLTVMGDGYGGLEHRWSSSLVISRRDLPVHGDSSVSDGYRRFLGLCSHEYFHLWNVKRMKPQAFTPYDLSRESHTGLLWAFEGITSYYDDLTLVRSGLIEAAAYLELLGQTITRVVRGPGRHLQSVEESSFDAWTKFYKQEANASNAIVSYYAKGSLVALALDLMLRSESDCSLDDVMCECWRRFTPENGGMPEGGLESVAAELSALALDDFFEQYVRGTVDLPLAKLLAHFGVRYHVRTADGPQDRGGKRGNSSESPGAWLGASLVKRNGQSVVAVVRAGSPAEKAGIATGDTAVALDQLRLDADNLGRRLRDYRPGDTSTLTVFRRDELMRFKVTLETPPHDTCYLLLDDDCDAESSARQAAWLDAKS